MNKRIKKRKINYVYLFLKTRNIHLIKEIGMIPYYFKRVYNFNSVILTYQHGEYPFLETYCPGLKLQFIKKSIYNNICEKNVLKYLFMNAKRMDFLNLIYPRFDNFLYGTFYKLLNKRGFLYLKMDIHELFKKEDLFQRNRKKTNLHGPLKIFWFYLRKKIIESFFKKVDLISAESKELVGFLIKKYPQLRDKIIYIPNGVDGYYLKNSGIQKIPLHKRDNIILNVCRIGTPYKASEILMEAIGKLRDLKDWKVIYVGSIDEKFHKIREEFFRKHPDLKDKILFIGEVKERKELNKIYQKAKIFCLTSVLGSFEFTLVEALSNGDYIVSSDLPSAKDITKNGAIGTLYKRGDSDELSKILQKIIDDDKFLKELYPQILEYAEKNFFWNKIIQKLYGEILRKRKI